MEHLAPNHERDGSRNFFIENAPFDLKCSVRPPINNDVYVGQIPSDVDYHRLKSFFSQFGEIERVFEGRRGPSRGMKWAFISFVHPEDAYNLLQQEGRIGIAGSMLTIRPRDKNPASERERERLPRNVNRGRLNTSQAMKPPAYHHKGMFPRGFPPRSPEPMGATAWNPYPLLSKTLTVSNLPPEFTPKNLYELFSDFGDADGAFVYALPDSKGRRVGEVAMATYLFAQKALENVDGRYIDGYALEVCYKPAIPVTQGAYTVPMHMPPPGDTWSNPPPGSNPFVVPHLPPVAPPPPPSHDFTMFSFSGTTVIDVTPGVQPSSPILATPTPTVAPEPSPPPPYSALPPISEIESQEHFVQADQLVESDFPRIPYDPCNLFVKNLDDEVIATQSDLEKLFYEHGTITSAFLATHAPKDSAAQPVSKGFGFVAFSKPQEAELAKERMHGSMVGSKKIFVSYAEKKEYRQARLKALFANAEKAAEDMRTGLAVNTEIDETEREHEEKISRGSDFHNHNGSVRETGMSPGFHRRPGPTSPSRQTTFQGPSRHNQRSSPRKGKYRRQRIHNLPKEYHNQGSDQPSLNVDFHEDFPPLPKSVKPAQSPTLQKIAQASAAQIERPTNPFEPPIIGSRPPSSGSLQGSTTHMNVDVSHDGTDIEVDILSYRSSIQDTPALPRPPPPSSAELSTAGNTAPTTPTTVYVRPRITPQTLHDRLLRAHATLATLQEDRPLTMKSMPVSPLLGPTIDQRSNWDISEAEDYGMLVPSLDTTIGENGINLQRKSEEGWTGSSLIAT